MKQFNTFIDYFNAINMKVVQAKREKNASLNILLKRVEDIIGCIVPVEERSRQNVQTSYDAVTSLRYTLNRALEQCEKYEHVKGYTHAIEVCIGVLIQIDKGIVLNKEQYSYKVKQLKELEDAISDKLRGLLYDTIKAVKHDEEKHLKDSDKLSHKMERIAIITREMSEIKIPKTNQDKDLVKEVKELQDFLQSVNFNGKYDNYDSLSDEEIKLFNDINEQEVIYKANRYADLTDKLYLLSVRA